MPCLPAASLQQFLLQSFSSLRDACGAEEKQRAMPALMEILSREENEVKKHSASRLPGIRLRLPELAFGSEKRIPQVCMLCLLHHYSMLPLSRCFSSTFSLFILNPCQRQLL